MADRIVVDVITGQVSTVTLTAAEIAATQAAATAEAAAQAAAAADAKDMTKFDNKLKALALWVAQLHGKTPVQAKNEIKAILDTL
jgi:hypothetical protein